MQLSDLTSAAGAKARLTSEQLATLRYVLLYSKGSAVVVTAWLHAASTIAQSPDSDRSSDGTVRRSAVVSCLDGVPGALFTHRSNVHIVQSTLDLLHLLAFENRSGCSVMASSKALLVAVTAALRRQFTSPSVVLAGVYLLWQFVDGDGDGSGATRLAAVEGLCEVLQCAVSAHTGAYGDSVRERGQWLLAKLTPVARASGGADSEPAVTKGK